MVAELFGKNREFSRLLECELAGFSANKSTVIVYLLQYFLVSDLEGSSSCCEVKSEANLTIGFPFRAKNLVRNSHKFSHAE